MKPWLVRSLVALTTLLCLGVAGYAGQVWWAKRVAQREWGSTCSIVFPDGNDGPQFHPGGYLTADLYVQGAIGSWKETPWYGQLAAWSPSKKHWVPRRVHYEILRLATGEHFQNDPEAWESWCKTHPALVWVEMLKRAVPRSELVALLKGNDPRARIGSAWALGPLLQESACSGEESAFPKEGSAFTEIAKLLEDENPEVRKAAAWVFDQPLCSDSGGSAVAKLLKDKDPDARRKTAIRLIEDGDPRVRRIGMGAIGELEEKSVASAVLQTLPMEKDRKTIRMAAWALGRLQEPSAMPLLTPLLGDEDPYMRLTAARALGRLGNKSGISIVAELLEHQEAYLQGQAANALQELTGRPWSEDYAVEIAQAWWSQHKNDPEFAQAGSKP